MPASSCRVLDDALELAATTIRSGHDASAAQKGDAIRAAETKNSDMNRV